MTAPPEHELDVFDPAVKADPYPHYEELRAVAPIVRNPRLLGQFMVCEYDAVTAVLNDPATFSNGALGGGMMGGGSLFPSQTMLNADPPDHERLRAPVQRAFTPRSVSQLAPRMQEVARALVAPLADGADFDVVAELAEPLPVLVIAEMLGVSTNDLASFRAWSHGLMGILDPMATPERAAHAQACAANLFDYFAEEVRRRGDASGDDLVSRLLDANRDGTLSEPELLSACVLLLLGGNETTTKLITNLTLALDRHPAERARVVADPSLVPTAVDEAMRFDTPVQANGRFTTREVDVAGYTVPQGSLVVALLAAANRDPARFESPATFDVGRDPNPHLGFSRGIHFCLGANLARLEARAALAALLEVAPAYERRTPDDQLGYPGTFFFHAPAALRIGRSGSAR